MNVVRLLRRATPRAMGDRGNPPGVNGGDEGASRPPTAREVNPVFGSKHTKPSSA